MEESDLQSLYDRVETRMNEIKKQANNFEELDQLNRTLNNLENQAREKYSNKVAEICENAGLEIEGDYPTLEQLTQSIKQDWKDLESLKNQYKTKRSTFNDFKSKLVEAETKLEELREKDDNLQAELSNLTNLDNQSSIFSIIQHEDYYVAMEFDEKNKLQVLFPDKENTDKTKEIFWQNVSKEYGID